MSYELKEAVSKLVGTFSSTRPDGALEQVLPKETLTLNFNHVAKIKVKV